MFGKLKKFLVLISCMILGLFLCGQVVEATEATLFGQNSIVIGEDSKDSKYYFTNSTSWTLKIRDYDKWVEYDTSLKYRVIKADGSATDWSDYEIYIDNSGNVYIDITELPFVKTVDVSTKNTVAPGSTYFVEIQYYSSYLLWTENQNKDETIKIIYNDNRNSGLYTPNVTVAENSAQNKYDVSAKIVDTNNVGLGVVTEIKYVYTTEKLESLSVEDFNEAYENNSNYGSLEFVANSVVNASIDKSEDAEKYLYVFVNSGNGHSVVKEFNTESGSEEGSQENTNTPTVSDGDDSGLFDYDFGEFILLILIIVLVVSCALIITQKIVDYKKRLY